MKPLKELIRRMRGGRGKVYNQHFISAGYSACSVISIFGVGGRGRGVLESM